LEKYAVIIDSTAYLSDEEIKLNDITKVSLNVIDKDEIYKEEDIDNDFVYEKLDSGHSLTTSQPSPGEFLNSYEDLLNKGYEKIFVVCLSSHLSGTYQSAIIAQNMLDKPDNVYIFNSEMAAFGNEMLTLQLIEMIKDKKSYDEIVIRINKLISSSNLIFTIENLVSLLKSGRLSKAKVAIGTVLRIKPLIEMVGGKLELFKSARTHKKVIQEITKKIKSTTMNFNSIYVRVLSKNSLEQARALEAELKTIFQNVKVTFTENLGPVFSLHLGKKGYGVSWCAE